jgi:hypothetical protein
VLRAGSLSVLAPAVLGLVAAACGGTSSGSSCGRRAVADGAAAHAAIQNRALRHYRTSFYSPARSVYDLEFVLGKDARVAGGKVHPPAVGALQVTNSGPEKAPLGSEGCPTPITVRIVYRLPRAAVGHLASLAHTVAPAPGGDRVLYVDYEFSNTGSKAIAPKQSALMTLTRVPGPLTATNPAAARALHAVFRGRPVEIMVDGAQRADGSFPFDGGTLCDVRWPNGGADPLKLVVAWDGAGAAYQLGDGDSCLSVALAANGTGETDISTPRGS